MVHLAQFFPVLALGCLIGIGSVVVAQESGDSSLPPQRGATTAISMELSAAEEADATCKLSFVVRNGHAMDVAQAVYETVLFDGAGQVSRLTLLDFQDLPAGRLRVRQFQFPQACSDISRVLINGAETCEAPDLAEGACTQGLSLVSRIEMELLG